MASPPSAEATLHPSFAAIGEARQTAIAARSTFFRRTHPRWLLRASVDRWDGLHQVLPTRGNCPRKKLSSGNGSRRASSPNRFLEEQGRIKIRRCATLGSNFWDTALVDEFGAQHDARRDILGKAWPTRVASTLSVTEIVSPGRYRAAPALATIVRPERTIAGS